MIGTMSLLAATSATPWPDAIVTCVQAVCATAVVVSLIWATLK
jgi:hypothetical protein